MGQRKWVDLDLRGEGIASEGLGGRLHLGLGARFGGLEVIAVLGRGWEASVYQVRAPNRKVQALKCYRRRPGVASAVERRAQHLQRIDGSGGTPRLSASCRVRWRNRHWPALLCDFRRGTALDQVLTQSRGRGLSEGQLLQFARAFARSLQQLHGRGAYHGDLHEGNLILASWGRGLRVHLVDPFPQAGRVDRLQASDVVECVRIFTRCMGVTRPYADLPFWLRQLARGMQSQRILESTPTVTELLRKLNRVPSARRGARIPAL